LFAGYLLAVLLDVTSEVIAERFRVPRWIPLITLVLLVVAVGVGGTLVLGARLSEQLRMLSEKLPQALASLRVWASRDPVLSLILPALPPPSGKPGRLPLEPSSVITGATTVASGVLGGLGALVVVFFIGVYGAAQPAAYSSGLVRLFPPTRRRQAKRVLARIEHSLARWLYGRLVAMAFVGLLTTTGLVVLHVPLALSLGVIAGAATFVEYLGAVASAVPPVLLALADSPTRALWVIALFTATHVIEGYVLTPLVTKRTVHLPPAFTLAVQVLFWSLFGVLGVTFATSTAVVLAILVDEIYVQGVLGDHSSGTSRASDELGS
jgi:predicted PurR-regulated permease PerM